MSIFGKQASKAILDEASGFSAASDEPDATNELLDGGRLEIWGWGCNSRGQLGPLAPSAAVVAQPQRLHVMQARARLDSISACLCFQMTLFILDAVAVAGLHHTALFTREITAAARLAAHKGMDVIRCLVSPPLTPFSPPTSIDSC